MDFTEIPVFFQRPAKKEKKRDYFIDIQNSQIDNTSEFLSQSPEIRLLQKDSSSDLEDFNPGAEMEKNSIHRKEYKKIPKIENQSRIKPRTKRQIQNGPTPPKNGKSNNHISSDSNPNNQNGPDNQNRNQKANILTFRDYSQLQTQEEPDFQNESSDEEDINQPYEISLHPQEVQNEIKSKNSPKPKKKKILSETEIFARKMIFEIIDEIFKDEELTMDIKNRRIRTFVSDNLQVTKKALFIRKPTEKRSATQPKKEESLLTRRLIQNSRKNENIFFIKAPPQGDSDRLDLTLYLFATKEFIEIALSISVTTVEEIIKHAVNTCLTLPYLRSKINFPNQYDAYELRFADDDEIYKPLGDIPPILRDTIFGTLGIESVVFMESEKYDPTKSKIKDNSENTFQKLAIELIMKKKKLLKIHDTTTYSVYSIQADLDMQLKDILPKLSNKRGEDLSPHLYRFRAYNPKRLSNHQDFLPEFDYNESHNVDFYDMNTLIQNIKTTELELVEKVFFDVPSSSLKSPTRKQFYLATQFHETKYNAIKQQAFQISAQAANANEDEFDEIFNEVSASKFKAYELIKINEQNKPQERILGIDTQYLYNTTKKGKNKHININTILPEQFKKIASTQNPLRPIELITKAEMLQDNKKRFQITYFDKEKKRHRILLYEAQTQRTAQEIVAKLNFIMVL